MNRAGIILRKRDEETATVQESLKEKAEYGEDAAFRR